MKKILGIITLNLIVTLFSPIAMAANEPKIAIVNVTEIYNKSVFVQKANKTLQEHFSSMEAKLQVDKNKLQEKINSLEKISSASKRKALAKEISLAQSQLMALTQQYQQKIQEEQNAGLQKFTQLVQTAVAKVAKEKQINSVLNSTSIVYTDNTWVDITNDVQAVMQQN